MATLTGLRRADGGRAAVPASPRPRHRSWALAVIGVLVVAVCALVFAAGWVQAGNRKPFLAVVHDVAAGQLLTAADLQVVRVSASGPVSLVPAAGYKTATACAGRCFSSPGPSTPALPSGSSQQASATCVPSSRP
jgi:hypothetical protein